VVRLETPLADGVLQNLARSFNQSETAFLWWDGNGWRLRWFTPSCEVPLCGHATLAACLALGHWGLLQPGDATAFQTRSGSLTVRLQAGPVLAASIDLPSHQLEAAPCPSPLAGLLQNVLGEHPLQFWRSSLGYAVVLVGPRCPLDAMAPLADQLQPQERAGLVVMQAIDPMGAAPGRVLGLAADYQVRFFAPGLGIAEDPVTGSAHALVAPYWLELLGTGQVVGWQCSPRPGGMLCQPTAEGKIRLTGQGHVLWDGAVIMAPASDPSAPAPAVMPLSLEAWLSL
jgi:PhzF family phenazine biosynthesis protein